MSIIHKAEIDTATLRMFVGRGGYRMAVTDVRMPQVIGIAFLDNHLEGAAIKYRDALHSMQARLSADRGCVA